MRQRSVAEKRLHLRNANGFQSLIGESRNLEISWGGTAGLDGGFAGLLFNFGLDPVQKRRVSV